MSGGALLVVPACEKGRGGGHLVRSMTLVRDLRALGREAWLHAAALTEASPLRENMLSSIPAGFQPSWIIPEQEITGKSWNFIILDRFQTPKEEFSRWAGLASLIGIDEGGPLRGCFDFLIDLLPGLSGHAANIRDPSLLPLPRVRRPFSAGAAGLLRALISFGREDSAGLGAAAARILAAENNGGLEITFLEGKLYAAGNAGGRGAAEPGPRNNGGAAGFRILEPIPDLRDHLAEYDLLITHFGQSAFEALYAGTPVLLVSPGSYHEKLAKNAGFFSAGRGRRGIAKLPKLLFRQGGPVGLNGDFLRGLTSRCGALSARHNLDREQKQSLASLINGFSPGRVKGCPACGETAASTPEFSRASFFPLARFADRSYYRCPRCGLIFMRRLNSPPLEYGREYFFDLYRKQYGKTYIEDFPHLVAGGKRRLGLIKSLLAGEVSPDGPRRLLDIGCAYGPFLAAAREEGFVPAGIDPAEDAVSYVRDTLGLEARQGFFPDDPPPELPGEKTFDAVTLWYVIEHFENCVPVFERIRRVLKTGGILAFSTPSFSGVSGRKSLARFLERSPGDHRTVWSPRVCKALLKREGFALRKIVVTGHHPERFPLIGKFAQTRNAPLYGLLLVISRLFSLGDTFEAYAMRGRDAAIEREAATDTETVFNKEK
ncbi:MAG: class I SAM-dependent methyltransferase [Treponema sp.]|nr:class I SAM-dependent methyltransferase [Treponema sp.]